jgi:ribonuclease P protein component
MKPLWRITDRATFAELRRRGRRARRGPLALTWLAAEPGTWLAAEPGTWLAAEPGTPPRVAFAVGRQAGTAVARNRVRRRVRAALHELDPPLPAGIYLVGAGPEAAAMTAAELRTVLRILADEVRAAATS